MTKPLHTTWMILKKGNQILLGHKKSGFGQGNLNGIGGKLEPNETPEQAAIRETQEEIHVTPTKFHKVGRIIFDELFFKGTRGQMIMHCFIATKWQGTPTETPEIKPQWLPINKIPYQKMWIDDQHWLPQVLQGKKIEARFKFNDNYEIIKHQVDLLPDHLITTLTDTDFNLPNGDPTTYQPRHAARAILQNQNNEIALIHSTTRNYYKLPGGGIKPAELSSEALHRETIEEAGYEIDITASLGTIIEHRAQFHQTNISHCYLARTKKFIGTNLTPDELADNFQLQWLPNLDTAIQTLQKLNTPNLLYQAKFFTTREIAFLKFAKTLQDHQKPRPPLRNSPHSTTP